MATWAEMSRQSFAAAEQLQRFKNRRSCVSRAYYAAFSAVTDAIRKKTASFPKGYEHPPHIQMRKFIKRNLVGFSKQDRESLWAAMNRLRMARYEADYKREADPDDRDVRRAMMDTRFVLETLGLL